MTKQTNRISRGVLIALATSLTFATPAVMAHSDAHEKTSKATAAISTEEHPFGKEGDAKRVDRTIHIDMSDLMRFGPADITVRQGETIKFVVANKGKLMHEMVIGTKNGLQQHRDMMRKYPGMEHDEPFMAHVSAGKQEEMVWQFTQAGDFYFACLLPGHFEAGMVGKIKVIKG